MKKSYLRLLLLLIFPIISVAQKDSFAIKLQQHNKQDSIRVELLVDACVNAIFSTDTSALAWAKEALSISQKINYRVGKIRSLNCLGNYYYQRSMHDKAIAYYIEALQMAEQTNDVPNIIIGKSNMASLYNHIHKEKQAIQLFKECDAILLHRGYSVSQKRAAILTNLATSFSSIGQHDSAKAYYLVVLDISNKLKLDFGIALSSSNLGIEYYYLKQFNTSLQYLHKADSLCQHPSLAFLQPAVLKALGRTYIGLNDYAKGIQYLNKAAALSKENKDADTYINAFEELHKAYAHLGNFKEAYQASLNYFTAKDSVFNTEKDKRIQELNTQYETEKKEQTIQLLTKENQITALQSNKKNYIIAGVLGLLFIAFLFFNRYRIKQQNTLLNEKFQAAEFAREKKHMELVALKSQMNPHFIFNALNSIQEFIILNDKKKANMFMGKYADLVRATLNMSDKDSISLEEEIKNLNLYLELEKLRFEEEFNYSISVDEHVDASMFHLPAMLVQPYIENAIKHGLLHKQGDKQLSIQFLSKDEASILCTITDNGIGRKRSAELNALRTKSHTSFATGATQKRLELLNQNKDNAIVVSYEDMHDNFGNAIGTKVTITISANNSL